MRILLLLCLLLPGMFSYAQTINLDAEEWTVAKEEKGMRIFFRNNHDNHVVECKIITDLEASGKEVLAYLSDCEHLDEWVVIFRDAELLKPLGPSAFLMYAKARSHMIEVDSDIILRFRFVELNGGTVGYYVSEPDSLPVVPPLDRIELFEGRWAIMELDKTHCRFTYHLATDLGPAGIGDVLARRLFLQANMDSVERLREHFSAAARQR